MAGDREDKRSNKTPDTADAAASSDLKHDMSANENLVDSEDKGTIADQLRAHRGELGADGRPLERKEERKIIRERELGPILKDMIRERQAQTHPLQRRAAISGQNQPWELKDAHQPW
ncbi:hypothetical protein DV736_g2491, partial [Chaetothyriales sp. CBS 134916]